MHSLEPSFNTTGPLVRASSIWRRFVTSTSSALLIELLTSFVTLTSSDLLPESLISVQPELKKRKQKIAKMKSDFLKKNGNETETRSLPCILCNRFIIILQKVFKLIFLAKKNIGSSSVSMDKMIFNSRLRWF